ncbi:MAG TPA: SusF/SusE family outer membrane protein [Bacteroidales bacterium]|nr:SusF/SusE family outer membrane protein [Bacteroidales bacterium]
MKHLSIFRFMAMLVTVTLLFASCTKEESDVRLDSKLSSSQILNLKSDSATIVGFVVAAGGTIEERGVVYSTSADPTIEDTKVVYTGDTDKATFNVILTGLQYATKYYAKAYITNENGTFYGEEIVFTTLPVVPTLLTTTISSITGNAASSGGSVTVTGGADITARGIVWSTSHNPTVGDSKTSDGTGMGDFTSALSNLKGFTTYYVRAYATNSAGTAYGPEVSFKTLVDLPKLTTAAITELKISSAKSGGEITDNGGGTITERGICWGTNENPTLDNNVVVSGQGDGSFSADITGLAISTTYHVRAYAKNSAGIGYGPDVKFMTYPPALYMIGDGVGDWDWANTDLPMIAVNSQPNLFWKIVWMKGGTGSFKFAPGKAWNNDFGKTGDAVDGVYNKGGDNIPVPATAGYYMVLVDFATNKIAITSPKVYLTGNTVGSWGNADVANIFTVDNANEVLTITKTLAADNLRMFVYHPWITDWWHAEFNIISNKIEFRGTGGDQVAVPVTAGSKTINLNFKTGDGSIL